MPPRIKLEYRRKGQPHFQYIGRTFSVTTLVHDVVPRPWLEALKQQREEALSAIPEGLPPREVALRRAIIHGRFEKELEALLARKRRQEHPFRRAAAARAVLDRLQQWEGQLYRLHAACVMSNHLHLLLDLSVQLPAHWDGDLNSLASYENLARVMNKIKGGSGHDVNRETGRRGPLWMPGYYDRYIRSPRHFRQAYWYILNNPVKAGLVKNWRDYPYTVTRPSGSP
jgi:REP element-mobilizing transposase RayT